MPLIKPSNFYSVSGLCQLGRVSFHHRSSLDGRTCVKFDSLTSGLCLFGANYHPRLVHLSFLFFVFFLLYKHYWKSKLDIG